VSPPHSDAAAHGSRTTGLVTIVLTLLGWSSVPLFLRHFTGVMDPWTSNGWRYGFAALIWAPVAFSALRGRPAPSGIWTASLVPALVNSVGQVFFTWAHYRIDPGLLTFGLRTQIIFVAAGAYLLFPSERRVVRSAWFWAGVFLLLCGTAGTVFLGAAPPGRGALTGIGMAVTAGMFFAAYGLAVRRYMADYPSLQSFAVISQYSAAAMLVLMFAFGGGRGAAPLRLPAGEFGLLFLSAVIGIAIGHVFYYVSIKRLGVAASSGVLQIQPICVGAASYVLFGEVLTAAQWLSGALAVAGALTILVVQARKGHVVAEARRQLAGR
jgi:drug/metabolite transporter (DMT)-like permease